MKKREWKILPNICNALITKQEPVSLTHFVTKKCNARCPHCFIDFDNNYEELNLENIEKIASSSGNCLANVALTGGEPFIRNDLFEIANIWYKNSTTKSIFIPTNGSMPDRLEKFLIQANKNNLPVSFCFSYDFIGEQHSEYRKIKDLHLKILESYKIIKSYNNRFDANFQITLSPSNKDSAIETYKYIRDEIKSENITCVLYRGNEANNLSIEEKQKLAEKYKELELLINEDIKNKNLNGYNGKNLSSIILNTKSKLYWKDIYEIFINNTYLYPCMAGKLFGIILEDGKVAPCELLSDTMGHLKDYNYNFMHLWNDLNAKKIRTKIKESKCRCTFECVWVVNVFSQLNSYPQIMYNVIKELTKN